MGLLFMDGFEHYAVADLGKKWTIVTPASNVTVSMDAGRYDSQSLKALGTGSGNPPALTCTPSGGPRAAGILGFALKLGQYPPADAVLAAAWPGGSYAVWSLSVSSSGVLSGLTSLSTPLGAGGVVPLGTWCYIEVKWLGHASAGSFEVCLNGVSVFTYSGPVCAYVGSPLYSTLRLLSGYVTYTGHTVWLDDVYLLDTTGAPSDFLGDANISVHTATADGTTNDGTASSGANYTCIDEALASATDYITSDTPGQIDTFPMSTVSGAVAAVQVTALGHKTAAGDAIVTATVRHDAANHDHGTPVGLGSGDVFVTFPYGRDPDGDAWTAGSVSACEFGIKKTA